MLHLIPLGVLIQGQMFGQSDALWYKILATKWTCYPKSMSIEPLESSVLDMFLASKESPAPPLYELG